MSLQTITLDFYSDPASVFCPVCGIQIFSTGSFLSNCPHLIFSAQSLPKSWCWHNRPAEKSFLTRLADNYQSAANRYPCFEDYLANIHIDSVVRTASDSYSAGSAFLLKLTTSDRGCGGMCQGTLYALFDFQPPAT